MGKTWEKVKENLKPEVEKVEAELGTNGDKVRANIVALLDKNGDGRLSIDDFFFLARQAIDTNGNGKPDFWEIISALFLVRRELKKIKG